MDTTVTSTTIPPTTLETLLEIVFPPTGLLRLVSANSNDAFFRRHTGGAWHGLEHQWPSPDDFITAHGRTNVGFSPVGWLAPANLSPMAACACAWAGVRYRLKAQQPHEPRPGGPGPGTRASAGSTGWPQAAERRHRRGRSHGRLLAAGRSPDRYCARALASGEVGSSRRWRPRACRSYGSGHRHSRNAQQQCLPKPPDHDRGS
jgi:hypothetical protein